jgi:hypothetical protein
MKTQQHENMKIQNHENTTTQQHENMKIQNHENTKTLFNIFVFSYGEF